MKFSIAIPLLALVGTSLAKTSCSRENPPKWEQHLKSEALCIQERLLNNPSQSHTIGAAEYWDISCGGTKLCFRNKGTVTDTANNGKLARAMTFIIGDCCSANSATCFAGWGEYHVSGPVGDGKKTYVQVLNAKYSCGQ